MTTEQQLKAHLHRRAAGIDVATLPAADLLSSKAERRTRRRRSAGALATVATLLVIIGVAATFRGGQPSAVFAGSDGETLTPTTAVFTGERYVGITSPAHSFPDPGVMGEHVIVASDDGSQWTKVEDTAPILARSATIAFHDGSFHLFSIHQREEEDTDGREFDLVHTVTTDLVESTTTSQALETLLDSAGTPFLQEVAVADSGVLVALWIQPDWPARSAEILDDLGIDMSDVCDMTGSAASLEYRLCGVGESVGVKLDPSAPEPALRSAILVAGKGEQFTLVTPVDNDDWSISHRRIFSTGAQLGISGAGQTVQSSDGATWVPVDTGDAAAPFIATRGTDRVYHSLFNSAPGFATGAFDMAFSAGGEPWIPLDLVSAYEDLEGTVVHVPDLRAGPAGWVLIAQRRQVTSSRLEIPGVDRTLSGVRSDFTLRSNGYELTGRAPFGPATLRNADGAVVRSWDQLEVTRPEWSGFDIGDGSVRLFEPGIEDPVVSFTAEQWTAIAQPYWAYPFEYDVLFSPNGIDWSAVAATGAHPAILAIGESEVVLRQVEQANYGDTSWTSERIELPEADAG